MRDHEAPSPTAQHRLPKAIKMIAGGVTFLLAVWGAYTGTVVWREDREVAVDLKARVFQGPLGTQGLVRFSVTNRSRHAITVAGGDLLLEGRKVGGLGAVRTDLPALGSFAAAPQDFYQRAQISPFARRRRND